jgi:hypothetical protein
VPLAGGYGARKGPKMIFCPINLAGKYLIMDSIFQAVRDLLKFKIVASVDTGDKTYDNLIIVLAVTIFTLAFSTDSMKNAYAMFATYYYRDLKNQDIAQYVSMKLGKCSCEFIPVKRDIVMRLVLYLMDNCCHLYKRERIYTDQDGKLMIVGDIDHYDITTASVGYIYTAIEKLLNVDKVCPIFISKFGAVGLKGSSMGDTSFLHFSYESIKALNEFRVFFNEIPSIGISNKSGSQSPGLTMGLYQYIQSAGFFELSGTYPIYPDRSFDNIVSKYKTPLLAHLEQFQNTNSGKALFNGFGSYNLGVMIYGLPGTGKTSFMKAICNHLKRDGYIYDMRTVKTNSQFKQIFKQVEKGVYIFDEFDCIQGVVNRENKEETESTNDDHKKELKDKLLTLLAIQHKESKDTQNITKEIEGVKKELKQLDEMLNLETLLTVLDGPCEMRNRVIVAATNYIDRIDPALLRPGRFDVKIKLEEFDDEETIELLEKMFAGDDYLEHIKNHKFKRLTPTKIINICHELHDLRKIVKALS